jgi:hypothetical protein
VPNSSIKWAAAAVAALALGASLPAAAQTPSPGQVQAVPRVGISFPSTTTQRAKIESIDTDSRTVTFTLADGRIYTAPLSDAVRNTDSVADGSMADVTYNQIVTLLNLRQKGPGSKEARREAMDPNEPPNSAGRLTFTITAIDLAKNTVSVIEGDGGVVNTYPANTPAKQEYLKKSKVGDVVIGMMTPLSVTAITPIK